MVHQLIYMLQKRGLCQLICAVFWVALATGPANGEAGCSKGDVSVVGTSMEPVIADGSEVTIGYGDCGPLERGDVVVLGQAGHSLRLLKRLIALPGDTFRLETRGGKVGLSINGEAVLNSAGAAYDWSPERTALLRLYEKDYGGVIPPGAVLVLGEGIHGTDDATGFGLVAKSQIAGRMISSPYSSSVLKNRSIH